MAPRAMSSLVARFLRLPRGILMAIGWLKRPFNYNVLDDTLIVGRLPRDMEDYIALQVCLNHTSLTSH